MAYGTISLDQIDTSGNLTIAGNVSATRLQTDTIRSASATPPTIQNSAGTEIGTFCRAWVNFNGTGTVAIRAAFNVGSITDYGAGRYQLNFTNPMPSANYMTVATSGRLADDPAALTLWERASNKTTTAVEVNSTFSTSGNNGYTDYESMNVAVFA